MQATPSSHVDRALSDLRRRAKASAGDPFGTYRDAQRLPDIFEYGMNCMLDRVFEAQGPEVAQLMYEALKEGEHLRIHAGPLRSHDVANVPVLFAVIGQRGPLLAYNRAIDKGTRAAQAAARGLVHGEHPIISFRLEGEREDERCWRLAVIDMALKERCVVLCDKGDSRTALIYERCGNALEELAPILKSLERQSSVGDQLQQEAWADAMTLGASAFEGAMPEERDALAAFLALVATEFWPALWGSLLDVFVKSHGEMGRSRVPEFYEIVEEESAMLRRHTPEFGSGVTYETRRTDIGQVAPRHRAWLGPKVGNDVAAILYATAVCGSLDYGHEFPDAILSADWTTQRCLFLELARMNRNDLREARWGGGIGRFSPLNGASSLSRRR